MRVLADHELSADPPDHWGSFGWLRERSWLALCVRARGDALATLVLAFGALGRVLGALEGPLDDT